MARGGRRTFSEIQLVNSSLGDPVLFIDYPGKDDALLFDCGDIARLDRKKIADLEAVFITHHHFDHFCDFDRIIRLNLDGDKTLHIFGPIHTIERVYQRMKSFEIQHFPMQKVVYYVHELTPGKMRTAMLDCAAKFPEPEIEEKKWKGPVIYQNSEFKIEAAPTDHTVPGLAYALVEKTGYHPDGKELSKGILRPGAWVNEVLKLLREDADPETILEIEDGQHTLASLADRYFAKSRGSRVTFITDTAWSEESKPGLIKLANKATTLYCDCYYARAQTKPAAKHRHMVTDHAAELANAAKVEEMILIHFAPRYAGRYEMLVEEARESFANTRAVWPHEL